jgi:hypothetical protein
MNMEIVPKRVNTWSRAASVSDRQVDAPGDALQRAFGALTHLQVRPLDSAECMRRRWVTSMSTG